MGHIAIRLNPRDMKNPDLDLRYRIPDLVAKITNGRIEDDAYDYADGDTLVVYLLCENPEADVREVIEILRENELCKNQILDTAVIGISNDAATFTIVHPENLGGQFTVDPW